MSEPLLGTIALFGFNFAPRGWAFCQGQLLAISQNSALFSLLGTTYGGNGTTTFALPDLRGRVPMGQGSGPGLSPRVMGEVAGTESLSLVTANLPAHVHGVDLSSAVVNANVRNVPGNTRNPTGAFLAAEASGVTATYSNDGGATGTLAPGAITISNVPTNTTPAGSNIPIGIVQPYLVVNYCIALEGIFPSRN
jgi:microcystin-dependent protein